MSEPAISKATTEAGRAPVTGGRISRKFRELAEKGELGLVAYITAGDPSLDATEKIVLAAAEAGADVIELGVPFSDPCCRRPNDSTGERTVSARRELLWQALLISSGGFVWERMCRSCFSVISIRFCRWGLRNLR